MRNPLHSRFGRQLLHNAGRYLGIFALLVATISVVSGCLITISSVQAILENMDEKNSVEDARFEASEPIGDDARAAVEDEGVTVFDNWSREATTTLGNTEATVRLYVDRTQVDTPSYYEGRAPQSDDEVALDRTFATHHGIAVGDQVVLDEKPFTVCGIMVLPDYTSLMRSNGDFVMDSLTFSVGLVSRGGFERFSDLPTSYTYSLVFDDRGLSTSERTERESNIAQTLSDRGVALTSLLDREQNQGISYLTTDMQGDGAMFMVFLYVLIAILAFVFVILTNATIEQESSVIGTLLASGWRKGEILRHYLFLPALVGLVACAVGSVLGFTLLCDVAQGMYYNSYSLPPFHITFDAQVFLLTTVVPYVVLLCITFVGLARKLGATPLAFLRHEVSRGTHCRNLRLPARLGYVNRFRLRLLVRNLPMLATLLLGVFAGSFLLMFALSLMPFFTDYANNLADSMPTRHIYALKVPYELQMTGHQQELRDQVASIEEFLAVAPQVGLDGMAEELIEDIHPVADEGANSQEVIDQAEKLCISSFQVSRKMGAGMEDAKVYGIQEGSRYWTGTDVSDGRVVVGAGLLNKCDLKVGGTVVLYDKFTDKNYALTIDETNDDPSDTNIYMSQGTFNETFGKASDWFDAYASDDELKIDADYLSSTTTPDDMRALADQIIDSFGDMIQLFLVAAALVFFVMMYLLTKTVLDHSARSISYMKVFGYRDREIRRLYLGTITFAVAAALVVTVPLVMWGVGAGVGIIMLSYSGNFVMTFTPKIVLEDLAIGVGTYILVAFLHMRHIKRVPLALALKTQE